MKLKPRQKQLRKRLMEVIYQAGASHIGSALNVIDLIDVIFEIKTKKDRFVLSSGHAAAAYYVVLEKNGYLKNVDLNKLGVHPDRNPRIGIDASTGSLGQGLPIALGMALADGEKNIYCIISDGEAAEGSIWEALRIYSENFHQNLKIIIAANGWGAYDKISRTALKRKFRGFDLRVVSIDGHQVSEIKKTLRKKHQQPTIVFARTNSDQLPFFKGLTAHYQSMNEKQYQLALKKFS